MASIGFIGAGNMAEAIIKGIISSGKFKASEVYASDISHERLALLQKDYGLNICSDNVELVSSCDIVVLSIKPQVMQKVLEPLSDSFTSDKLVISIAAGIKIEKIVSIIGDLPVVRVMPNTPALVGEGASGICGNAKAENHISKAVDVFSAIGKAVVLDNENMIDAVTALSGSGPAYYFLMMEEMIKAGIALGLEPETAKSLTLQTALGAAKLAMQADEKGETPDILRQKVTSPGGTTQAALEFFADNKFGEVVNGALTKARDRSVELSK